MNQKFFLLPEEKQQAIINAGFRVFSRNEYRKSPMREIAEAAGISKSLLFHYFHNKKELYLFLWETCAEETMKALNESQCDAQGDFFDTMMVGIRARIHLMRVYPDLSAFSAKAFYETDPEVYTELQKSIAHYASFRKQERLLTTDPAQFKEGLDLEMMYRDIYWATEGYIWEKLQADRLDADEIEKEFMRLIAFWKSAYART